MSNLTFYDRLRIEYYLNFKRLSKRDIAKLIGRNHTVVIREINRHKPQFSPYSAELAQKAAERKAKITNKPKLVKHPELLEYVFKKLKLGWSPEQIAGRLKNHPPPMLKKLYISHEQIYEYIQDEGRAPNGEYLYKYLPKKKPRRQKRGSRKPQKVVIPDRVPITKRPKEVEAKAMFGHFEGDLMFCKRKPIAVQYEKKSQLVRIQKLPSKQSEDHIEAVIKSMETLPYCLVKTLTLDNGSENAKHTELNKNYGIQTYFCDPYSAWQKGGVENMNGLLRRYLPKKTDLTKISQKQLYRIQELINNRPRKSLNYLTPNEILQRELVH